MSVPSIFTRFLDSLGVRHTAGYSDTQFRHMTFRSLYGLSHLLTQYGVSNYAVNVADKREITAIEAPFLAQTNAGIFVIVTDIDTDGGKVSYDQSGKEYRVALADFIGAWNGVALLAFPDDGSGEPDYASHYLGDIIYRMSGYVLVVSAMAVVLYFFITRGVYAHVSTLLISIFDGVGLYFSYLLLQKSLDIHTAASDRVCGVLEKGGCDSIMSLKVSRLFGVFSWSEVGFGYFGISLATLLIFPHLWPDLALFNACCLPYTVWSIWYQRFRVRHWCTLCVGVQCTLWILFFCYLGGGWWQYLLPLHADTFILLAAYVCSVLSLNMILRLAKNLPCYEKDKTAHA